MSRSRLGGSLQQGPGSAFVRRQLGLVQRVASGLPPGWMTKDSGKENKKKMERNEGFYRVSAKKTRKNGKKRRVLPCLSRFKQEKGCSML